MGIGESSSDKLIYDNLMACGGKLSTAKEKDLLRAEGKDYEVKDGDICHFLFNV